MLIWPYMAISWPYMAKWLDGRMAVARVGIGMGWGGGASIRPTRLVGMGGWGGGEGFGGGLERGWGPSHQHQ